jgi:hypothetical protein
LVISGFSLRVSARLVGGGRGWAKAKLLALKSRCAFAHDDWAAHEVEFVNQIIGQQVVPKCVAAKYQAVVARLAFAFGNLRVRVSATMAMGSSATGAQNPLTLS